MFLEIEIEGGKRTEREERDRGDRKRIGHKINGNYDTVNIPRQILINWINLIFSFLEILCSSTGVVYFGQLVMD